jgi:hypothetical protein
LNEIVDTGFSSTTLLRHSTIFGNELAGILVGSGTTAYSYRDNSINANGADIGGIARY